MKAITTTYVGATERRPARILATDQDGNRIWLPADSCGDGQFPYDAAHRAAAEALCRSMRWPGAETLIGGSIKGAQVWVFGPAVAPVPPVPVAAALTTIAGLTLSDCLRFFDARATERDKAIAALADDQHGREGACEIDHALTSEGNDNGAYVLAWVWADFAGSAFDKGDADDEDAEGLTMEHDPDYRPGVINLDDEERERKP